MTLPLATGIALALHIRWWEDKVQCSSVMLPSAGEVSARQCCMNNSKHAYLMHGKEVAQDTL